MQEAASVAVFQVQVTWEDHQVWSKENRIDNKGKARNNLEIQNAQKDK